MTELSIGKLCNINKNTDVNENMNNIVPLKKEENVITIPNYSTLLKSRYDACFTNNLIVPQNLILSRNIQVFLQLDDKIHPIFLTRKQYKKVKRNVQCSISNKTSIERKPRNSTRMNGVFIGEVKVKPRVLQTLHYDREVQTDLSEIKKIAKLAKRKYYRNMKIFNEILNKSNSTKCINETLVSECRHSKYNDYIYNNYRHVSSIEIDCKDVEHVKLATSSSHSHVMKSGKPCLCNFKQHNSIQTLFKGRYFLLYFRFHDWFQNCSGW